MLNKNRISCQVQALHLLIDDFNVLKMEKSYPQTKLIFSADCPAVVMGRKPMPYCLLWVRSTTVFLQYSSVKKGGLLLTELTTMAKVVE